MPYIKKERRKELDAEIDALSNKLDDAENTHNMGDYNYVISKLIHEYIKSVGLNYSNLNEVVGMLECCKSEFIRTIVSPYEDKKIISNGGVSELDGKEQ